MSASHLHLNLLRDSERLSSSPVRLRVMMPILAALAVIGCGLWWITLFTQLLVLRTQISSVKDDLVAKKNGHAAVLTRMAQSRDMQAELDQLEAYANSRQKYGVVLANLASVMPAHIQLTRLEIPMPPMPNLTPANPRQPPLFGPTGTVEKVSLRIVGRTTKSTPVNTLMESLGAPVFTNIIRSASIPKGSFRQDNASATEGSARLLVFELNCTCTERRFEH